MTHHFVLFKPFSEPLQLCLEASANCFSLNNSDFSFNLSPNSMSEHLSLWYTTVELCISFIFFNHIAPVRPDL